MRGQLLKPRPDVVETKDGKTGSRRALRGRAGSRRARRGRPVLQGPVLGAADGERRNRPGVRGVLFEVPEASMSAAAARSSRKAPRQHGVRVFVARAAIDCVERGLVGQMKVRLLPLQILYSIVIYNQPIHMKQWQQEQLPFRTRGGKRRGAGRKTTRVQGVAPHTARPEHKKANPVHATLRVERARHAGAPDLASRHGMEKARARCSQRATPREALNPRA
jgi:hypothetical protein